MNLENARELKANLLANLAFVPRGHATAAGIDYFRVIRASLAVGLTEKEGEFALALRAREDNAVVAHAINRAREATKGEIDVRYTGPIRPLFGSGVAWSHSALGIGMSIGRSGSDTGTLGCFAKDASGAVGVISNNHVLAAEDQGANGDAIVQPGPDDGGSDPRDTVGFLVAPYPQITAGRPVVDCAFALIREGAVYDPRSLGGSDRLDNRIALINNRIPVEKIGRTTGRTSGVVSAFDIDNVVIDYPTIGASITFDNQIEIEDARGTPFGAPGDSGSLVFDQYFQPVGLLFATATNLGLTYANAIQAVLTSLGVQLVT